MGLDLNPVKCAMALRELVQPGISSSWLLAPLSPFHGAGESVRQIRDPAW
jgi:hypothetical protein